jgi:hypothetical protein
MMCGFCNIFHLSSKEGWGHRGNKTKRPTLVFFLVPTKLLSSNWRPASTSDTVLVKSKTKSREMRGRSQTLPWWLRGERVKTTENKLRWVGSSFPPPVLNTGSFCRFACHWRGVLKQSFGSVYRPLMLWSVWSAWESFSDDRQRRYVEKVMAQLHGKKYNGWDLADLRMGSSRMVRAADYFLN